MAVAALCKLKVALFLCVCLAARSVLATTRFDYCDKKGNYAVKVKEVNINPDPVRAGEEAVFSLSALAGEDISGGKVEIDVSYFIFHVHNEKIDLCKESSCPISVGDFVISHKQTLPSFTPPGSYTLKMQMYDSNNRRLTCISFGFSINLWSPISEM